jgi:death-on-curing protein
MTLEATMKKEEIISAAQALKFHARLINETGGSHGLRDEGLLKSALARPLASFDDKDFYPSPEEKGAAILESIVRNHPFIDGNKRTGYVLMRLVLLKFGKDIIASENEKYDFVIAIASGNADFIEILDWIRDKITQL